MDFIKRLFGLLLNPRPRLAAYPSVASGVAQNEVTDTPTDAHRRSWLRAIFTNIPLIFGGLIVLGLFLVVLFGPLWAPKNPYITGEHIVPHFDTQSGEGFQPGAQGDWGAYGLQLYNLAVAEQIMDETLTITSEFLQSDHTTFSEAGHPAVLMSWRLASEDNLPDGFSPGVNPERLGVVARLTALLLMILGQ